LAPDLPANHAPARCVYLFGSGRLPDALLLALSRADGPAPKRPAPRKRIPWRLSKMLTRPDVVVRAALVALVMAAVPASGFGQGAPAPAQPQPAPAQPAPAQTVPGQPAPPQPATAPPVQGQQPTPAPGAAPVPPPSAQPVPPAPTPAGQGTATTPASQAAPIQEQRGGGPTKRLTIEEAVQVALEQNLDVQVERINPQLSKLQTEQAEGAWLPNLTGNLQFRNSDQVPNSFLSGANDTLTSRSFSGTAGYGQIFKSGTQLNVGFDAARSTSNNTFSSFNPQLSSSVSFDVVQPLLRGFKIDVNRAQFRISKKNEEITDVQLRQQIIATARAVRLSYWNLVGTRYNLGVAQASLDISRQTLRDNRTRVEVGTMAPIDVVGAEAEVARNEEAAIVAAAQIDEAEDALRSLLFDPKSPEFWTMDLDLADAPQLPTSSADVDVEGAVKNAISKRTDLIQLRKQLEVSQINLELAKDLTRPVINAQVSYGLNGLGGVLVTQRGEPDPNNPFDPGPVISTTSKGFGSVLGDLVGLDFPTWTVGVQFAYPLGNATQKVALTRNRLAYQQQELSLRSSELGVATEVRTVARSVNTNRKRVESTTSARVFSERQLDAARKKFAVGLAQSIDVLIAQRDLATARFNELSAIIDYVKSLVDFEAVQEGGTAGVGLGQLNVGGSTR
jgi:outer membrane protein